LFDFVNIRHPPTQETGGRGAVTIGTDLSRRNLMKEHGNSFPEIILVWTIGAIGV
jgi:hypothetical protein